MDGRSTGPLKELSAQADGVEGKLPSGSSMTHLTAILLLARDANRKNLDGEQLTEQLKKTGLSEEQALCFANQWDPKAWSLSTNLGSQGVATNRLVDMEWRFGGEYAESIVSFRLR
uniref:COMM domain-containing protein n=1 Tax=Eptatretus burgeri TaxID=7764 RepID=A0A8C4NCH4_EPTBU